MFLRHLHFCHDLFGHVEKRFDKKAKLIYDEEKTMCRGELSAVIVWLISVCETGESAREELEIASPFPCSPVYSKC